MTICSWPLCIQYTELSMWETCHHSGLVPEGACSTPHWAQTLVLGVGGGSLSSSSSWISPGLLSLHFPILFIFFIFLKFYNSSFESNWQHTSTMGREISNALLPFLFFQLHSVEKNSSMFTKTKNSKMHPLCSSPSFNNEQTQNPSIAKPFLLTLSSLHPTTPTHIILHLKYLPTNWHTHSHFHPVSPFLHNIEF